MAMLRPLLLAASRLAIFLALGTWIATQWWIFSISTPLAQLSHIGIRNTHWTIARYNNPEPNWSFRVYPENGTAPGFTTPSSFPGVSAWQTLKGNGITLHHWLLVTVTAVFFVAVRLYLRSRRAKTDIGRSAG